MAKKLIRTILQFAVSGEGPLSPADIAGALLAQAKALGGKPAATKPTKGKKGKDEDHEDDESDSDSEADDDGDEDGGSSDSDDESEDGEEDEDGGEDEDEEDSEDGDGEDEEDDENPSQKECIGLLKKLADLKNKKFALATMKKSAGVDSIYDIKKSAKFVALKKALQGAIKKAKAE